MLSVLTKNSSAPIVGALVYSAERRRSPAFVHASWAKNDLLSDQF
jgi:hypothetical protein